MCPACITTAALVAAGSASGVGVLGFFALKFRSLRRLRDRIVSNHDR
jgi:hypothetical protein